MKKEYIHRGRIVALMITAAVCYFFIPAAQSELESLDTLPFEFSTIAEHNFRTGEFIGVSSVSGIKNLVSIQSSTGEKRILSRLPALDGLLRNTSALDAAQGRFFFIGLSKDRYYLCSVSTRSGEVDRIIRLAEPVKAIEYDPVGSRVVGFCQLQDVYHLVGINDLSGKIEPLKELPQFTHISSCTKWLEERQQLIFIGRQSDNWRLCTLDRGKLNVEILNGFHVGVNEFHVTTFLRDKKRDTVFTTGVQSCIGVAGFDPVKKVGFVAHFSSQYKGILPDLEKIEKMVRVNSGAGDFRRMKFAVAGGVKNNADSVRTLHLLYKTLVKKYGVEFRTIRKYNTGTSHNIAIINDSIIVF